MTDFSKPDRVVLLTIQFVALVSAAVALAAGAIAVANAVGSESVEMLLPSAASLPQNLVGDPDAVGIPRILGGAFVFAEASIADPGAGVRTLLALGSGFGTLVYVALALTVAYLCWRLYKGNPFGASVTRAVWVAAAALTVGSLLSQGLLGFASWSALNELRLDPALFPLEMYFDFVPIIAGLALLLVASAFQLGERMKRDTEGLV